ncbi:hypothetical protein, partial [Staphylococcus aureus]
KKAGMLPAISLEAMTVDPTVIMAKDSNTYPSVRLDIFSSRTQINSRNNLVFNSIDQEKS